MRVNNLQNSVIGKLVSDSALYGIANIINQGFRFLFIPILTYNVSPDQLGAYDAARNLIVFGVPLISLGMESAVGILMNQPGNSIQKQRAASSGMVLVMSQSLLALVLLSFSADKLYTLLMDRTGPREVLWLAIAACVLAAPTAYARNLLKWQFRRKVFSALLIGEAVVVFLTGSIAVIVLQAGVIGWMVAIILASSTTLLIALLANANYWQWPELRRFAPSLWNLGFPIALVSLSAALTPIATRTVLVHLAGLAEVGVFGVAERVAMIGGLIVTGFTMAWGPFYLSKAHEAGAGRLYGRVALYYLVAVCWIGLAIILFGKWLVALMAPAAYASAQDSLFPLVASKMLLGLNYIVMAGIYVRKKTYHLIWIHLVSSAAAVAFSVALVPDYGGQGAAWSAFLANLLGLGLALWTSQRLYPIEYDLSRLGRLALCLGLSIGLELWVTRLGGFWGQLVGSFATLSMFVLLCIVLRVLDWHSLYSPTRGVHRDREVEWT